MRVLTDVDGDVNPYVLTWSDDVPNTTWAIGSGACTFYNTSPTGAQDCNTHMERDYENNTFVITATKDIKAGDELLHVYKGLGSRACFQDMDSAYEPIPLRRAALEIEWSARAGTYLQDIYDQPAQNFQPKQRESTMAPHAKHVTSRETPHRAPRAMLCGVGSGTHQRRAASSATRCRPWLYYVTHKVGGTLSLCSPSSREQPA